MEEAVPDGYRICICGAEGVGKTALLNRFLRSEFSQEDDPTIEDRHSTTLIVDNKSCALEILDTGGSSAYSHLHDKWFSEPDAFIVAFSVSMKYSFELLGTYIKKIEKVRKTGDFIVLLVGTQTDMNRIISAEQVMEIAYNHSCNYVETSAKKDVNVSKVFEEVVRELRIKKKENELLENYEVSKMGSTRTKKGKRQTLQLGLPKKLKSKGKRLEDERKKEEDRNEDIDTALSIVADRDERKRICAPIPKLKVAPLKSKVEVASIAGPNDECSLQEFKNSVAARSVSGYPLKDKELNLRDGDPVCDQYCLTQFENRTIVAVADGCNWGPEVKLAAQKSARLFNEYMKKHQKEIRTTREVGYIILRAFLAAHNSIIEGRSMDTIFQAGTTTMAAGMMLELDEPTHDEKWGFVCVSLGDCKAYHWSSKNGIVTDVTQGNRQNIVDASDPGGRLGPYRDNGKPDLRNLLSFWKPCHQGDIIFLVSDGIHDNIDPQQLGKLPSDLGITVTGDSWRELERGGDQELYAEAERRKNLFAHKYLNALVGGEKSLQADTRNTPASIVERLIGHALEVTKESRDFMEQNPGKKLPKDYGKFPGKMDHITVCAFEVGMKKGGKVFPFHKKSHTDAMLSWEEYKTEEGDTYFYNTLTKVSSWEDPFRLSHESDWRAYHDEDGEVYFYNKKTGECSWEPPKENKVQSPPRPKRA